MFPAGEAFFLRRGDYAAVDDERRSAIMVKCRDAKNYSQDVLLSEGIDLCGWPQALHGSVSVVVSALVSLRRCSITRSTIFESIILSARAFPINSLPALV